MTVFIDGFRIVTGLGFTVFHIDIGDYDQFSLEGELITINTSIGCDEIEECNENGGVYGFP